MNITNCLLASGFITSSFFYTIYKDISTNKINKLRNLLNEKQNKIFDNIKKERLEIYQASILIGLLIAYYYTSKNYPDSDLLLSISLSFTSKNNEKIRPKQVTQVMIKKEV